MRIALDYFPEPLAKENQKAKDLKLEYKTFIHNVIKNY